MQIRGTHELSMHKADFFQVLNFSILFIPHYKYLAIYFNKLRTLRRFTKSESDFRFVQFFIHPVLYNRTVTLLKYNGRVKRG